MRRSGGPFLGTHLLVLLDTLANNFRRPPIPLGDVISYPHPSQSTDPLRKQRKSYRGGWGKGGGKDMCSGPSLKIESDISFPSY